MTRALLLLFCLSSLTCFSQNMLWRDLDKGIMISDYEGDQVDILLPRKITNVDRLQIDSLNEQLYFINHSSMWRVDLDGSNLTKLFDEEREILDFSLDLLRNKIYYTDDRRMLKSSDFYGRNRDTLITELPAYSDFLVNPYNETLYWSEEKGIYYSNLDGSDQKRLVSLDDGSRGIQIDLKNQKLYWLETNDGRRFYEVGLDGRDYRLRYSFSQEIYPFYFYYEPSLEKLYFTEVTPTRIYEYDFKVGQLTSLKDPRSTPRYLAVHPKTNQIFWTESSYVSNFIGAGSLDEDDRKILVKGEDQIRSFTIDTIRKRFIGIDTRGAIVSTDWTGKTLKTHVIAQPDKISSMIAVRGKIYLHDGRKLGRMDFDGNNFEFLRYLEGLTIETLVYVPKNQKLYFISKWDNILQRCNLDGTELETILELQESNAQSNAYSFTDMVYSEFTDRLYISNTPQAGVFSVETDGSDVQSVYSDTRYTYTNALAVDDINGFLYYVQGSEGHVYKTDLNTGVRSIFYRDIEEIDDLIFDPSTEQLYLLENTNKRISILSENNIEPVHLETDNVNISADLLLLPTNELIYSLYDSDFQMAKLNLTTSEKTYQVYHNRSSVDYLQYDHANNDLWGINFHDHKVYKVDLDTDEISRFAQFDHYGKFEILSGSNSLIKIDQPSENLLKYNYINGSVDTLFSADDFRRITDFDYAPHSNRIYFTANVEYGFQSIDTSGNDHRIELITPGIPGRFIFNPVDNSFTNYQSLSSGSRYHRSFIDQDTTIQIGLPYRNSIGTYNNWNIINSIAEEIDADGDGVSIFEDCDDQNPNINPTSVEIPDNGIDENCDGIIGITDLDGDGFGILVDCDDSNPLINPGAEDIVNNDIDENCDGALNIIDNDGDGYNSDEDCDDSASWINPGAAEIPNNTIDENCDGIIEVIDEDGDNFNSDEDCDDTDPNINPNATEIINNDVDEDCDGIAQMDIDLDGFLSDVDCDDNNPDINPDAAEIPNNTIDENCDDIIEIIDVDGDNFNSDEDCDDTNPNIYPGAPEILDNGIDEDCNGRDSISSTSTHQIGATSVELYPNPFDNYLFIKNTDNQPFRILITDLNGKTVFDESRKGSLIQINLKDLISGIYFLQLTHQKSNASETIQVIKQ